MKSRRMAKYVLSRRAHHVTLYIEFSNLMDEMFELLNTTNLKANETLSAGSWACWFWSRSNSDSAEVNCQSLWPLNDIGLVISGGLWGIVVVLEQLLCISCGGMGKRCKPAAPIKLCVIKSAGKKHISSFGLVTLGACKQVV